MDDYDLTGAERAILLDLLSNGDNIPANISDNTGLHSKSVSRSLSGTDGLEEKGLIRNKGRGVYTLTKAGLEVARSD